MKIKSLVQTTRPSFLILAPITVLLGLSLNWHKLAALGLVLPFLVFAGALLAHISVNMFNEYFDYKSGLDLKTNRTPFSGGSGALPANPDAVTATFIGAVMTLMLTCGIGIYLMLARGAGILPVGIAGVLLVYFYTNWINQSPWLCLLAPGFGFGILMVMGADFVMTGQYAFHTFIVALVPFFLTNNLLLLNQYPDIEADASIGRRTFPIVYGVPASNVIYIISSAAAYMVIILATQMHVLPTLALVAIAPAILSAFAAYGAIHYGKHIGQHQHFMAANVGAALLTPLLLALVIIMG